MTADEYRDFRKRHNLRLCDTAWMCNGMTQEAAVKWSKWGVRGAAHLLLKAYDDGLIPLIWFKENIEAEIPD